MNVICNSCDTVMDEGDVLSYEEREMAASNLVYHKGSKCPFCGVCDDFDDVDWRWALDELYLLRKRLATYARGDLVVVIGRRSEAESLRKRIEAIKDLIEGEIE